MTGMMTESSKVQVPSSRIETGTGSTETGMTVSSEEKTIINREKKDRQTGKSSSRKEMMIDDR
jgi:hypothetical protein